jgi:thioredoxin 1
MSENACVVTSANFEQEVLKSGEPVLVDFWAQWCPPCRMIAPVLDALAVEYKGRVKVAKLDVDGSPDVAGRYGVQAIPTLLLFRDGKVVEQRIGALPRPELVRLLDAHAPAVPAEAAPAASGEAVTEPAVAERAVTEPTAR